MKGDQNDEKNHNYTIKLNLDHQELEYRLMNDMQDLGKFSAITGNEINVSGGYSALAIRYHYKEKEDDGFQIKPITGKIKLTPFQFRMEREGGKLWSINVFKLKLGENKNTGHDSEIDPPEPPVP